MPNVTEDDAPLIPVSTEGRARKAKTTVSVAMSPDLLPEVRKSAAAEGLSLSAYFRALHADHLRRRRNT